MLPFRADDGRMLLQAARLMVGMCLVVGCWSSFPNTNCGPPCFSGICPNETDCIYGSYSICGGCCQRCRVGPGEFCLDVRPPCGDGLHCEGAIVDGIPELRHPGRCVWIEDAPTTAPPTTEDPDDMMTTCREPCSVDFCSEMSTRKKRICSAAGLSPHIEGRNDCQHTTCGTCFLLKDPDCHAHLCPEPPNKQCLRRFLDCVRDHYFHPNTSIVLRLEDPAALNITGRVICHVPEVSEHDTFGQDDSSTDENARDDSSTDENAQDDSSTNGP